jgi:nitrilase
MGDLMKVAAAQLRPVWLDKRATAAKVIDTIHAAAAEGVELLAFSETYLAGYPFWICRTNGAAFEDPRQQRAYAQYLEAAVEIDSPLLADIAAAARDCKVAVWLGMSERGRKAGRGSVYCTLVTILPDQGIVGAHRKLMPTHDERLCWGMGDARDLRAHDVGDWRVGGLNCWENLMPLARAALYAEGEDLHINVWPGNPEVSSDCPRIIAIEGRVWSVAASGLMSIDDVGDDFEFKKDLLEAGVGTIFRGGSRIVDPQGNTVVRAEDGVEGIISCDISLAAVRAARMSFDPTGHYARDDIFRLSIERRRGGAE